MPLGKFKSFHFRGQKDTEVIMEVVHRHWFDILKQMFLVIVMIIGLLASYIYLPQIFPRLLSNADGRSLFLLVINMFATLIWLVFFLLWIDYYLDVWIITNERVINIEQKGLFVRQESELELENIQDITTEVKGMISTFLNYGDLYIQTAAEKERFVFRAVPGPYYLKDLLMKLEERQEAREAKDFGKIVKKEIQK